MSFWTRVPDWNAVSRAPLRFPARSPEGREWTLAAVVFSTIYCVSGLLWSWQDHIAPMWDQSRHAWNALRLAEFLRGLSPSTLGDAWVWHDSQYGWAGYLPAAIAHLIGGSGFDVDTGVMTLFWTPILLWSMWSLGLHLTGERAGGFSSLAWVAASPMVVDLSKDMLLDLPLLSLTALGLALLFRSRFLMERRSSAGFGAVVGCLLMVKAVMPITFIAVPVVMAAWNAWRIGERAVFARNLLLAAGACAVVALPFHVTSVTMLSQRLREQVGNAAAEGDPTGFGDGLATYVGALMHDQARGVLLVPLVLGALLWLRLSPVWSAFLGASSVVILLVWPLFPNKDPRYTLPLLAYLGMYAAGGVLVGRKRLWASLIAVLAVGMLLTVQWGIPSLWAQKGFLRGVPDARDASMDALVRDMTPEMVRSSPRRALMVHAASHDEPHHNTWNLVHDAWVHGRHASVVMDPSFVQSAEYLVQTDCGQGAPPVPAGFAFLSTVKTPQGCTARGFVNREMQRREALMKEQPAIDVVMRAGMMEHHVVRALVPPAVKRGDVVELGVLVKVASNRRPVFLTRSFSLGPLSTTWKTPDDAWNAGDTYPLVADLVVPSDAPSGSFPLVYRAEGATFVVDGKERDSVELGTVTVQ